MSFETTLLMFRGIERLLIVIFAGGSLILGWNLFKSGINLNQSAEFEKGNFKLKMLKVGPGIFFALFGCIILSISLHQPFEIKIPDQADNSKIAEADNSKSVSYLNTNDNQTKDYVKSINTIGSFKPSRDITFTNGYDSQLFSKSVDTLIRLRDQICVEKFGSDTVALWKEKGEQYLLDRSVGTETERKRLENIRPWMIDIITK